MRATARRARSRPTFTYRERPGATPEAAWPPEVSAQLNGTVRPPGTVPRHDLGICKSQVRVLPGGTPVRGRKAADHRRRRAIRGASHSSPSLHDRSHRRQRRDECPRPRARTARAAAVRAWLAASYGEALAADAQQNPSLRRFDEAATASEAPVSDVVYRACSKRMCRER